MRKTTGFIAVVFLCLQVWSAEAQCPRSCEEPVKNVILMIGDGMGLTQLNAAMYRSSSPLSIERAQFTGLTKTSSASNRITDSAAAGTALATGHKTYNGAIGLDTLKQPLRNIMEMAREKGLATGVVATYCITNATPAAFVAHVPDRKLEEDIAMDFLRSDIDLFIGGGRNKFEKRSDSLDLSIPLREKGYRMVYTMEELEMTASGKVAGLLHEHHLPRMLQGRGDFLPRATVKALEILHANNPEGFVVMIEGSQIDGGGHARDIDAVTTETFDFDEAVKEALDFADTHPGTLVIITADHETGGLTIPKGGEDGLGYHFSTGAHTAVMVPVYSYGPGAHRFTGIMENTEIPRRIMELLDLK